MLGFGAHFDRRVALRRAVAELGQIAAVLHPVDAPASAALPPVSLCSATARPAAAVLSATAAGRLSDSGTEVPAEPVFDPVFGPISGPGSGPNSGPNPAPGQWSDSGLPPRRRGHPAADPPLEQLRWWQALGPVPPDYLRPDPDRPTRSGAEPGPHVRPPHADLRQDVEDVVEMVRAAGLELLVLDQTRPDVGMPVVKVVVPGMRPARARLAPGRLFDVPAALGRRPRPPEYRELNPVPLVI
ncbi:YcaO-like family protein [Catenulispora yoronensis]